MFSDRTWKFERGNHVVFPGVGRGRVLSQEIYDDSRGPAQCYYRVQFQICPKRPHLCRQDELVDYQQWRTLAK